jgi:hypothetical protein
MNYLTRKDVDDFGPELIDVAQRAAQHAVGPELQRLHEENDELRGHLASETRARLDQALEREVPQWRQIDSDPRWLAWLAEVDALNGCTRQALLNDAIVRGNAGRVIRIFQGFLREMGAASTAATPSQPRARQRRSAPDGKPIYTRSQITEMARRRQKGLIDDAAWARWEYELIAAGREGRIVGALGIDGVPVSR